MSAKWQSTEKTTCTKWSSPWPREAGALHWFPTAGFYTIPISLLPASRNNLRKKIQPARSFQSCSEKENQRTCFHLWVNYRCLKGFCSNSTPVSEACVLLSHSTAWIHRDLLQALHLLPSKSSLLRHLSYLRCSSSLPTRALTATGNLTYVTSSP